MVSCAQRRRQEWLTRERQVKRGICQGVGNANIDVSCLRKGPATKSDDFLEKFQTAIDPPPSFLENYVANIL